MRRLILAGLVCATATSAAAGDLTVLVAPPDSAAAKLATAAAAADGKAVVATTSLDDALIRAATHLAACGPCAVTVKLAAGTYANRGGQWKLADTTAPKAALRLIGGYADDFQARTPLATPSSLAVVAGRSGAVLDAGTLAVRELTISGLAIDAGPGNRYDAASSSLQRGRSPSSPLLGLSSLTTDRLIIADNLFFNAPSGALAPMVRPISANAEIVIRNNLFANNVQAISLKGISGKLTVKRIVVADNSFVLNFPATADTTTSNPGAVELGSKSAAVTVELRGNLFAYNLGGAIVPQWDAAHSPAIVVNHNLFWRNGELFTPTTPADGAVVAKGETFEITEAVEARGWKVSGNLARDPAIAIPIVKLRAHNQAAAAPATLSAKDELDSLFADPAAVELDTSIEATDYTEGGVVKNFAPRMPFNPTLLPSSSKLLGFGASSKKVP